MIKVNELVIYPLNDCNLRCKHCYNELDKQHELSFDEIKWINDTFSTKKTIIMGGEPLMYKDLEYVLHLFPNVTISTNTVFIEDRLSMLQNYRDKLTIQISIEGGEQETNDIRGSDMWMVCMYMAKLLKKNNIKFYFRSSYHHDSLKNIVEEVLPLAEQFDTGVMLLPRIDLPPINEKEHVWLFKEVIKHKHCAVAQPHFFQFINKPGRCKAGDERINIYFDKRITPCNLDLNYTIGHIGDKEKSIVSNMQMFTENFKVPPNECNGCPRSDVCHGSCYVSKSYMGCPLRYNFGIDDVIMKGNLDGQQVKQDMNLLAKYVRDLGIC